MTSLRLALMTGMHARTLSVLAFALGLSLSASAASAQYYGAIGYSPATGAMGWGLDYRTSDAAARTALTRCRDHASDCQVAILFKDGCAVVVSGDEAYAVAASPSRGDAERVAMRRCRMKSEGCTVQRWVCTTGSMY